MIFFLIKICIMLAITLICWRWLGTVGNKRGVQAGGGIQAAGGGKGAAFSRKWGAAVGASCLAIYVSLACLLSCVWLKGDDYIFLPCSTSAPAERFFFIFGRYINWVSRSGEIVASVIGLSENRWQAYLLIPAMVTALPFALHRLVAPAGQSIFSARGVLFLWFCVGLALVSVSADWRNYWCFAASQNYLLPMTAIFFFLSLYRPDRMAERRKRSGRHGKAACAGMFLLGLYCGWALECISVFMLPGLLFWCWRRKAQGLPVSAPCWAGLLGAAWGAFMLFASPALGRRAEAEAAACTPGASGMGFSQMLDFCLNLTPENLRLLQGRTVNLFLGEIPLPLHVFFLPELMRLYLPCCAYALAACALLGACLAFGRGKGAGRALLAAAGGVLLSFLCACSYLYSCVPRGMSYLPPAFIMLASASFLFLRCGRPRILRPLLAAAAAGYALLHILPAGMEAWEYRPARALRMQELHAQLDRGEKRITLHHHWAQPPVDSLGLISRMDLTAKAEDYPNFIAAKAYGAESIALESEADTKH